LLRFLYPAELQSAGCIPISSSATAARTAVTKRTEPYHNFANVPHPTVFELVKLKPELKTDGHAKIQKLISVSILGGQDEGLGLVQLSRKGVSPDAAGADLQVRSFKS
jgi:hypothetical protein